MRLTHLSKHLLELSDSELQAMLSTNDQDKAEYVNVYERKERKRTKRTISKTRLNDYSSILKAMESMSDEDKTKFLTHLRENIS